MQVCSIFWIRFHRLRGCDARLPGGESTMHMVVWDPSPMEVLQMMQTIPEANTLQTN